MLRTARLIRIVSNVSSRTYLSSALRATTTNVVNQDRILPSRSVDWGLLYNQRSSFHRTAVTNGVVPFNLSDIGEGISEVTIKEWYVKEGDTVKQFDAICEVQSDKASVTITSRYDGVIKKLHHDVEAMCKVGSALVDIDVEGGADSAPPAQPVATPPRKSSAPPPPAAAPAASAATSGGNIVPFKLSDIGEGISEVTIKEWFVKVGDKVNQFDPICEVQSDKASVTITSRFDGVINKVHYDVEAMCKVGAALVDIQVAGGAPDAAPAVAPVVKSVSTPASSAAPVSSPAASSGKVLATPAVRRMAGEHKINLSDVVATGKGGRVLKDDLFAYLEGKTKSSAPTAQPTPAASTPIAAPQVMKMKTTPSTRTEPLKGYTKAMVKSMTKSLEIPHFGYKDEVDVSALVGMRKQLVEEAKKYNVKLSYMPFFIKAASLALHQFPVLNASLDDAQENLIYKGDHNIGLAMDTPIGLVKPNIKNCESKSILEIGAELNRLQKDSQSGQVKMADLTGATFSLSNIGSLGGTYTQPVISLPEVCIGALGKIQKVPRFDANDNIYPAHILYISWSADHRVIDGATVCRFSNLWKDYLENPQKMLLHLS